MGGMSQCVVWRLIQNDLGCSKCKHLIRKMDGVGPPCENYFNLDIGVDGCPGKELKSNERKGGGKSI